jgi:hypothetical protein
MQGFHKKSNPLKLTGGYEGNKNQSASGRAGDDMKHRVGYMLATAGLSGLLAAQPVAGQRLLDEWRVRTTAGAEALVAGPVAVFWNPSQLVVAQRGEALVADLRAPGITGVDGLAAAVAVALDERTTLGIGYEYMGVGGIERTTTSPEDGVPIDIGENRFALAASHTMNPRMRVGALVQYTRMPEIAAETGIIALGGGLEYQPSLALPLKLAGMAATEGDAVYWLAGVALASGPLWTDWRLRGEYGAAGGDLAPGTTHRLAAIGEWREHIELALGAASEPDGTGRTLQPVVGAEVRLHRYRLGMVREELANDFGGAWSFRFSVGF